MTRSKSHTPIPTLSYRGTVSGSTNHTSGYSTSGDRPPKCDCPLPPRHGHTQHVPLTTCSVHNPATATVGTRYASGTDGGSGVGTCTVVPLSVVAKAVEGDRQAEDLLYASMQTSIETKTAELIQLREQLVLQSVELGTLRKERDSNKSTAKAEIETAVATCESRWKHHVQMTLYDAKSRETLLNNRIETL
ncbi:hypothetical protein KIPB_015655, partial [Kipferlia bialata]|eukprot:g15655.t1